MSKHKIIFEYAPKRPNSMSANCKCGWTGFTNIAGQAVVKAKKCLREMHEEKQQN